MEIRSNNKAKHRSQRLAFGIFRLLSLCIVLILFAILGFIIYKGAGAISWEFITSAPTDGMTGGGIWPAIVGTFYLMVGSALFAFPVGVMSGISEREAGTFYTSDDEQSERYSFYRFRSVRYGAVCQLYGLW